MDEEIYQVLMGDMPKAGEMSKALRRQHALGQLGMITGDRAIAPAGAKMFEDAGNQAWRETQADQQRRGALARAIEAERDRKFQAEQNRLARLNAANIAAMRDKGSSRQALSDLKSLGKQYSGSGIPDLDNSLTALETTISKYGEDEDLPGAGMTGLVPMGMLSKEGRELRQQLASVRNILLKTRSGSAVTDQEFARFAEELGQFMGASDAEIRRSLPQIRASLEAAKRSIFAGYDPEVADFYQSRLGAPKSPDAPDSPPAGLKPGDEEDGYRYVGGDPSDPDSWEPAE